VKNEIWNTSFDNVVSKELDRAGVCIIPTEAGTNLSSYKLTFEFTKNMVEYEALILSLKVFK
jgi:hypothetical protein